MENKSEKKNINPVEFFRETKREVMKVTWPARRETIMTTVMILVMALAAGVFFLGVDSFLGYAVSRILSMGS
ncbi:MAG: preprotein translocase subunit SecE [Alphaproteobacteria bacterium]|nr:preprotein translocase subunit SecE [Alphaproteobacteria bacterium]